MTTKAPASGVDSSLGGHSCRACGSGGPVPFYSQPGVPAQTCVLLADERASLDFPLGEMVLAVCSDCGFVQNLAFDQDLVDYSRPTEESQAFSPRFRAFAEGLAASLVERHGLAGRSVLEVGCGKGDFLVLLGRLGVARGLGIDPGFIPERSPSMPEGFDVLRDWYGPVHSGLTGDLVMTRHLMEHVPDVAEFFGWLAESCLAGSSPLFTEVPDATRVLETGAFWDVYYEHCSYFTPGSLARAIRSAGMGVTRLELGFDGQYILAESVLGGGTVPRPLEEEPEDVLAMARRFTGLVTREVERWRELVASGRQVAVWGGGSKAVAFLSALGVEGVTVVDINPHKQGKWLPGLGIQVQSPAYLRRTRPELVVPMNPVYEDEITAQLESMGLFPTVISL